MSLQAITALLFEEMLQHNIILVIMNFAMIMSNLIITNNHRIASISSTC